MPNVDVIAIKDLLPLFRVGDNVTIVPVLYEEDTLIRNEIFAVFKDNEFVKIADKFDWNRNLKIFEIRKIHDKLFAPKGSYKDSYIVLENGCVYPSSLIRRYEDYFIKKQK
jgi:hypothetical protein